MQPVNFLLGARKLAPSVALFLFVGCGGDSAGRVRVYGTVTVDSVPIPEGHISFFPVDENQGPTSGGEIKDGRYDIGPTKGPVAGTNRVEISGQKMTGRKVKEPLYGEMIDERIELVPPEYRSEKSTLKRELKPGDNQLDFDLKSTST